jgi:REP element-mobilizing transposase RayT
VQCSDAPQPIRARIRRWYVPNAVYFITAVTLGRRPLFGEGGHLDLLRNTMHEAQIYHPFTMHAYVFMPDHLHMLIHVPATTNISKLMQSIQRNFTLVSGAKGRKCWCRKLPAGVLHQSFEPLVHP